MEVEDYEMIILLLSPNSNNVLRFSDSHTSDKLDTL